MSDHDYDRRKTARDPFPYHKPAEAGDLATKSYLALLSFKNGFDVMEEIPQNLQPYYDQCLKAIAEIQRAQKEIHQLQMMARKLPR